MREGDALSLIVMGVMKGSNDRFERPDVKDPSI